MEFGRPDFCQTHSEQKKKKKLNHKVSRLCGEMRKGVEKYCNLPVPLQSRQTYGRMFNLLSSP